MHRTLLPLSPHYGYFHFHRVNASSLQGPTPSEVDEQLQRHHTRGSSHRRSPWRNGEDMRNLIAIVIGKCRAVGSMLTPPKDTCTTVVLHQSWLRPQASILILPPKPSSTRHLRLLPHKAYNPETAPSPCEAPTTFPFKPSTTKSKREINRVERSFEHF